MKARPKLVPVPALDLEKNLTRIANVEERARDASMPLLGLCNLHEKLVEVQNDQDHGDVMTWYQGYYLGSVQEAIKGLAQVIDFALEDVESTVRPMLSEVRHGKA